MSKRGRDEERAKEAVHTIVASDWSEQQQDCNLLPQTLWAGDVNISPMAIRALSEPYSEHGFTPDSTNDDSYTRVLLRTTTELFNIAHFSQLSAPAMFFSNPF